MYRLQQIPCVLFNEIAKGLMIGCRRRTDNVVGSKLLNLSDKMSTGQSTTRVTNLCTSDGKQIGRKLLEDETLQLAYSKWQGDDWSSAVVVLQHELHDLAIGEYCESTSIIKYYFKFRYSLSGPPASKILPATACRMDDSFRDIISTARPISPTKTG